MIATPGGKIASNQLIRNVPIKLGSKIIKTDLILLALEGINIILGVDWMTWHGVTLDLSSRAVEINSPTQGFYYSIFAFPRMHKFMCSQ
jgi:hypothetical protein